MRDMKIMVLPRKRDRRLELSFKLLENNEKRPNSNLSSNTQSDTVISLDIHNAMALVGELESGIRLLMDHVHETLTSMKHKSTPELAQEDPTHRKKA